jgi:hypothetical protein
MLQLHPPNGMSDGTSPWLFAAMRHTVIAVTYKCTRNLHPDWSRHIMTYPLVWKSVWMIEIRVSLAFYSSLDFAFGKWKGPPLQVAGCCWQTGGVRVGIGQSRSRDTMIHIYIITYNYIFPYTIIQLDICNELKNSTNQLNIMCIYIYNL